MCRKEYTSDSFHVRNRYQPPSTRDLLALGSFLFILPIIAIILDDSIRAGLVGQMLVGAIYGAPLANILSTPWQETFLACGYLGLILLVFEGGISTNLSLFTRNFSLSVICALTGVVAPVALSILWLTQVFRYTTLQSFIAGASLSATSLGTTIAILRSGDNKSGTPFVQSPVATVLMTAALVDDVIGLITASIISELRKPDRASVGWVVGRPILASGGLMLIIFAAATVFKYLPRFKYVDSTFVQLHQRRIGTLVMMVCLIGVTAAAAYAGTSILFGAFLVGLVFSYASDTLGASDRVDFRGIFHSSIGGLQEHLVALFFASIGFSIPFRDLWNRSILWKGIVYSIFMILGKMIVGIWIPIWSLLRNKRRIPRSDVQINPELTKGNKKRGVGYSGLLLGAGMVARGEIGLLICQIGFNGGNGPLPKDLFAITIWALVLNTVLGPIMVSFILRRWETQIRASEWGNTSTISPRDDNEEAPPIS